MNKFKSALVLPAFIASAFILVNWGGTGHRIISLKSALSFNEEMVPFWNWTTYLTQHSTDADSRRSSFPDEAPYHYIDMDNYPEFKNTGKISQSYAEVVKKHGEAFVIKQGILPWTTLSILDSLTQSFKEKNFEKAAFFASDLGHFVADGHMPLHLTGNYDGQLTGNKGIHGRYESRMINQFENNIRYLGKPAKFIENTEDFVFNYLCNNYIYLDSILLADRYSAKVAGNSSSKIYTETLWNETNEFTELLLAKASHAFASLLYTAWVNAGSPKINKDKDFLPGENENQIWQIKTSGFLKRFVKINLNSKTDSKVNISVYNKSGEYIETIVKSLNNSKPQNIEWKPNTKGKEIYFMVLKTKNTFLIEKVVL